MDEKSFITMSPGRTSNKTANLSMKSSWFSTTAITLMFVAAPTICIKTRGMEFSKN
jgi:hypothetical protein